MNLTDQQRKTIAIAGAAVLGLLVLRGSMQQPTTPDDARPPIPGPGPFLPDDPSPLTPRPSPGPPTPGPDPFRPDPKPDPYRP